MESCSENSVDMFAQLAKFSSSMPSVAFSCAVGAGRLLVKAWDISNGAVRKTYRSDMEGCGAHLCTVGNDYLMCAMQSKPFIIVWKLDKVDSVGRVIRLIAREM